MTKREQLLAMIQKDWVQLDALSGHLGWQKHTVRGALSTLGKIYVIERKREGGKSWYRATPSDSGIADAP